MADRFYLDGPLGVGEHTLDGPEAHHLAVVRRFQVDDRVALFNGDGHEYAARIVEVRKKRAVLIVEAVSSPPRELPHRLHIAAALPKGDRGDFLIEKLVELGATEFTPLVTERSVVKPDGDKAEKVRRAVIEASKQCGRNVLMAINPPARWSAWVGSVAGPRCIAAFGGPPIGGLDAGDWTVAVGPEGGFSEAEVAFARAAGWTLVSLGSRTLRVETAALAATAYLANLLA